jgi:two-component system alkaline phosphatase synthesis response regulator PhoP
LRIDFDAYEVFLNDRKIDLTLREFNLLRFLVESPNRVFSRVQILDSVWGGNTRITPRAIDVHIRRLRKRLELDDARPELIVTVRGVGYKFDDRVLISRGR